MTIAIKRPEIDAWRSRWESDPAITYRVIAESTGVTIATLRGYAVRRGWCRPPEVHAEMLRLASLTGLIARHGNHFLTRASADQLKQSAVSSVFDLGTGRRITTSRNHAEVYA